MRALSDRVLIVEEDQPPNQRASGLWVVDLDYTEWVPKIGRVLSVGSAVREPITEGMRVVYDWWHTAPVVGIANRRIHTIDANSILAVVES